MSNLEKDIKNITSSLTGFLTSVDSLIEDAKKEMSEEQINQFEREYPNIKKDISKSLKELSKVSVNIPKMS